MVEIGESSFAYLQIFYSLDYGIPLPNYKILCWVLALIFHIGCYIKDLNQLYLNFSHCRCLVQTSMIFPNLLKQAFLNEDDVLSKSYFIHLLQLFSLTHKFLKKKFKVTQALLARQGLGVITSWRCSHILTSRESWVSKS